MTKEENRQQGLTIHKAAENYTQQALAEIKKLEENKELVIPSDYIVENALKSAYLHLAQLEGRNSAYALQDVTGESVTEALKDMVIQAVSVNKKQCYFIPYGNQLKLQLSYFGNISVAKRFSGIKDCFANCIYKGDEVKIEFRGEEMRKTVVAHTTQFGNEDNEILGAYAVVIENDGTIKHEVMTKKEIIAAWEQGPMKGKSPAHNKFQQEMCKKTAINRITKHYINTSDDSSVLATAYNRTIENEYVSEAEQAEIIAEETIKEEANKKKITLSNPTPKKEEKPMEEASQDNPLGLTDKEKAEIEAAEKAQAENECGF